ncbi:MAG: hypothetical protein WCA78_08690 [Rhizomicrobium sp.]
MDTTALIALYGAGLSTVIAGLNIYQWWTRGPKLIGSVVSNMGDFQRVLLGGNARVELILSNRGNVETTITNLCQLGYENYLRYWLGHRKKQATIQSSPENYELPYKIGPGQEFHCSLLLDYELGEWTQKYLTYLCVYHSMADKPIHLRLMPIKTKCLKVDQ